MSDRVLRHGRLARGFALFFTLATLGSPAIAAGIASHTYTCAALQSLITAHGFVFISAPDFGDFVVADVSYCGGGERIEVRSVATSDRAECPVNYCLPLFGGGGGGP
ncbi:MAG: hypothetical protein ACHQC9_06020 [Alphaproteobacteria bacterium]